MREDLVAGVTRQRLLVEGRLTAGVGGSVIRRFRRELSAAFGLGTHGEPAVFARGWAGGVQDGYEAFAPLTGSGGLVLRRSGRRPPRCTRVDSPHGCASLAEYRVQRAA